MAFVYITIVFCKYTLSMQTQENRFLAQQVQRAAKDNNLDRIKFLLEKVSSEKKYEILSFSEKKSAYRSFAAAANYGNVALEAAIENNNVSMVEFMLEKLSKEKKYALVKTTNILGWTLLHWAASRNNPAIATTLLEGLTTTQQCSLLSMVDQKNKTALHVAAKKDNTETTISCILKKISSTEKYLLLNQQDVDDETILNLAAETNNLRLVRILLQGLYPQQKLSLLKIVNWAGYSPLHRAIKNNNSGMVQFFCEDLDREESQSLIKLALHSDNYTLLHAAVESGDSTILKTILDTQGNIKHWYQAQAMIELLDIKSKSDEKEKEKEKEKTALALAQETHFKAAEELLEKTYTHAQEVKETYVKGPLLMQQRQQKNPDVFFEFNSF